MRYWLAGVLALAAVGASRADAPHSEGDPGDTSSAESPIEAVHDLAALTPEKALLLNGKRAVFRIEIVGRPAGMVRGTSPYPWCRCIDGAFGYVELPQDVNATSGMTVEATLKVVRYPPEAGGFPAGYYFVLSGAMKRP